MHRPGGTGQLREGRHPRQCRGLLGALGVEAPPGLQGQAREHGGGDGPPERLGGGQRHRCCVHRGLVAEPA
eukprot:11270050-Alexandrium_andersonii.AAC.1